jgi:hypothetical protein
VVIEAFHLARDEFPRLRAKQAQLRKIHNRVWSFVILGFFSVSI